MDPLADTAPVAGNTAGRREYAADMDPSTDLPVELPNGPAKVTTDLKNDRFKLDYAGDCIFQASVKLVRDDVELSMKDAGARLFVVSKSDGWNVVTQTVRVTAVAVRPGDTLSFCGHTVRDDGDLTLTEPPRGLSHARQDWFLCVDAPSHVEWISEEASVRGQPGVTRRRLSVSASGSEVILVFRPHYLSRHQK